ncbi:MAG: SlyX protein [Alphaproteobacteria bacterium]|jgi:SlyX protein
MTESSDIIRRIDDLETHIAHQDSIIEELNDVSIKQWAEIKKLNERLDHLKNKFEELEHGIENPTDEDLPPPHY